MKQLTEARPRIGARRARIHLSLAIAALCLTASGSAAHAQPMNTGLPPSWSQFAGSWERDLPGMRGAIWDDAHKGGQTIVPAFQVDVQLIDGAPKVVLTRFETRIDFDGTLRFVPVRVETSRAYALGNSLTFSVYRDPLATCRGTSEPVDTAWKLELNGNQMVLSSLETAGLVPAPVALRRYIRDPKSSANGC